MADESIRKLFDNLDEMKVQVTRIEVLLTETVLVSQQKANQRLDRHRIEINTLKDRIRSIEEDKRLVISYRKNLAGAIALVSLCAGIAASIAQLMR